MLVAVIGTTLSAYLYTWQSNEEVEEEKAMGRVSIAERRGASKAELQSSGRDVLFGMFFSNLAMYFIILAAAATLFKVGKTDIASLDIEFRQMSVYDVAGLREKFDVVIFMGVLYHLRHPLLALDLIHEHVARDMMIFQSMQRGSREVSEFDTDYPFWETAVFEKPDYPVMHFVEHSYAHDPTNWWIPNRACVEAMLRSSGFEITGHPEEEVYICRRAARD